MTETLADIGEFGLIDLIQQILQKEGMSSPEVKVGIGDDCACFRPHPGYGILVTCDCVVEGRHYLPEHITPLDLGRRTMALNISDIGAMGGRPLYALVSLGLKTDTLISDIEAIYRGFIAELKPFEASIIGGNLTMSEGPLFLDVTLIGEVKEGNMVQRSGARAGDAILITGYPGQAAVGLQLLLNAGHAAEALHDHPLVRAYNTPSHRALEGEAIAASGYATAMIDTSDGLPGDLGHICRESNVGAVLIREQLPISEDMRQAASQLGMNPYEMVLNNSDDYELLITCSPDHVGHICSAIAALSNVPVTEVGRITDTTEGIKLMLPDGTQQEIKPAGWDHFA